MYIPHHFEMKFEEDSFNVIDQYSFAVLFSQHDGVPYATHLPLILDETRTYLYGHFSRQNRQWQDIEDQYVMAVFQGPHSYISPSWYETKDAVPTWNYVAVHVYGHVEITNPAETLQFLHKMVLKYEETDSKYQLNQVDSTFLENMATGITGFKIRIDKIEGKAKLSQNHPMIRQDLVIQHLEKSPNENDQNMARLMRGNLETSH